MLCVCYSLYELLLMVNNYINFDKFPGTGRRPTRGPPGRIRPVRRSGDRVERNISPIDRLPARASTQIIHNIIRMRKRVVVGWSVNQHTCRLFGWAGRRGAPNFSSSASVTHAFARIMQIVYTHTRVRTLKICSPSRRAFVRNPNIRSQKPGNIVVNYK